MKKLFPALVLLGLCGCSALTPAALPQEGTFRIRYPGAASVQLVGDWNCWGGLSSAGGMLDPESGAMTPGADGYWTATVDLPRGRYRYAFIVDGSIWMPDESNHVRTTYGGREVSVFIK